MQPDRKALSQTFKIIDQYIQSVQDPDVKVNEFLLPDALRERFDFELQQKGTDYDALIEYIRQYLHYSVKTGSKQYLNQLFGGTNMPALLGEFITSLTNTSMYTYEVAPMATLMEMELVKKMNSFTGFSDGDGIFLTGGSNTNLVAMIAARNHKFPETKKRGTSHLPPLTAFVSDRSHFSFTKAANAMGMGSDFVIKVATDGVGKMIPEALKVAIEESIARGEKPFFVGATCGTTETGAFDSLSELAPIAQQFELWMHADGSWGGSSIMSPQHRYRLKGIEECDSFSWNPHKMMNIPLICSVLLMRQKGQLKDYFDASDTSYIYHENDTSAYNLGPKSLQCGRRVDALKLWMAWKFYGDEGYIARINQLYSLAHYATSSVRNHPDLELMCATESLNVNFRFTHDAIADLDAFNKSVRQELLTSGKSMVNYCHLSNGLSIRLVLLNPDLTTADLDQFFGNFVETAQKMLAQEKVSA